MYILYKEERDMLTLLFLLMLIIYIFQYCIIIMIVIKDSATQEYVFAEAQKVQPHIYQSVIQLAMAVSLYRFLLLTPLEQLQIQQ